MPDAQRAQPCRRFRVALLANDEFGLRIARCTVDLGLEVVAIFVPSGIADGNPDLRKLAVELGCPVHEVTRTWPEVALDALCALSPDLTVMAWWPYLVPESVVARAGRLVNMHPGLLPADPGMDPYSWALLEGRPAGACFHLATAELDAGPVIAQRELAVSWSDTADSVLARGVELMVELYRDHVVDLLQGRLAPTEQPRAARRRPARRRDLVGLQQVRLADTTTIRELLNRARACDLSNLEHPGLHFVDGGRRYRFRVTIEPVAEDARPPPGR